MNIHIYICLHIFLANQLISHAAFFVFPFPFLVFFFFFNIFFVISCLSKSSNVRRQQTANCQLPAAGCFLMAGNWGLPGAVCINNYERFMQKLCAPWYLLPLVLYAFKHSPMPSSTPSPSPAHWAVRRFCLLTWAPHFSCLWPWRATVDGCWLLAVRREVLPKTLCRCHCCRIRCIKNLLNLFSWAAVWAGVRNAHRTALKLTQSANF